MNAAFNFPMTLALFPLSTSGGGVVVLPRDDICRVWCAPTARRLATMWPKHSKIPVTRRTVLGIAISRDEGATWTHQTIALTQIQNIYIQSTAVDADGNLYIAWTGPSTLPYLTISRDRGNTWSTPIPLAAPGVQQVRTVAIAARRPGEIALAYQGTTDGTNFNGYITSTRDALAKRPIYWSATVNDPAEPLVNGSDSQTFGDRILYLTNVIGSDGSVWAGFHCAKTAACPGQRLGVMGRLAPNPFKEVRSQN